MILSIMLALALGQDTTATKWTSIDLSNFTIPRMMFFCRGDVDRKHLSIFIRHDPTKSVASLLRLPSENEKVEWVGRVQSLARTNIDGSHTDYRLTASGDGNEVDLIMHMGEPNGTGDLRWKDKTGVYAGKCDSVPPPPESVEG